MTRRFPTTEAENCDRCPAFMADQGSTTCASGVSVIPSRLAAQVTDGVWNAVVTTLGKGTFLIRRRKNQPANRCPLRSYEVRHIEVVSSPSRKRAKDSAVRRERTGTCRDLLVRGIEGRA